MSRYWKSIIAVVGLAATVLTSLQPVWGDNVPTWVPIVAAVLTAVGVYAKANDAPAGQVPDPTVSERGYGAIELLVVVILVVLLILLVLRVA